MKSNARRDEPFVQISSRSSIDFQLCLSEACLATDPDTVFRAIEMAIEDTLRQFPHVQKMELAGKASEPLTARLLHEGIAVRSADRLVLPVEMLWQQPRFWLNGPTSNGYPLAYMLTNGKRHPVRPEKPTGVVYRRFIPWIDCDFSLRVVDIQRDLERFNHWQNKPRVAHFWQETGDLAKHRQYLEGIAADPHMIAFMGCFGDRPFAYLEAYWAKEDRIAPFYDAADYDRGWHGLVGEEEFLGKRYIAAWIPCFMHYMFLDDARTQRIVGEPRYDNDKILVNLERNGFSKIKHFDFPHKKAMLVMLLRERFFGDRLITPQWDTLAAPETLQSKMAAL